jgi:acetoin utilization deacetylase AcuC-like enzyme
VSLHVIWHPSSLQHDPGRGHPESPARIQAILDELRGPPYHDITEWSEAPPATLEQLHRVHPAHYLERLDAMARRGGGMVDGDTFLSADSYEAAVRAAGAAVTMVERTLAGQPAFAAVRPPGHHATPEVAMGFCLINNVVVAARSALQDHGVARVLIIDWDVHHGNGTQALVQDEPRIRFVSMHQHPLYPGTGRPEERGVGNVFNVPRPPGLPRASYLADLTAAVEEATSGWQPELVLISAGFDAMAGDPLAGFTLEPPDYATWIRDWRGLGAPVGAVLEGGYVPERIRLAAGEMVRAMATSA